MGFCGVGILPGGCKLLILLAPEVGLEPTTLRLTAECSAIELLRSVLAGGHLVLCRYIKCDGVRQKLLAALRPAFQVEKMMHRTPAFANSPGRTHGFPDVLFCGAHRGNLRLSLH